jgi:hypothetical protein
VTVVALIAGGNMIRRFASRLDTIVTGDATAGYRGVIHEDAGVPR